MIKVAPIIAGAVAAVLLGPCATAAQLFVTFVSGDGDDMNPCTRTAPCRSFAAAVPLTAPGGTVTMVDPGGYGAVTITHAISIVNDGVGEAGVADMGGAGQDAITIQAGPSDVVNLRGLTLNGLGTGRFGISFTSGGTLNIQNCVIRNFANVGVNLVPSAAASVTISDTIVSNTFEGVLVDAPAGTVTASLQRVTAIGNAGEGIALVAGTGGTTQATIVDSVATGNGRTIPGRGFFIGPNSRVTIINSKAIGNGTGLLAESPTFISKVTIAGNVTNGFSTSGSNLQTFGDNYIIDTTNVGTLAPISAQ
jgi:hypothetical protein